MTTKKKGYVKPIIATEEFVPQEYVAVCLPENGVTEYYLACDGTSGDGRDHSEDGCRRPDAYIISVTENGYITSIYEKENNSGWWNGGEATNITVNGSPASTTPLSDLNGTYNLSWETRVIAVTMKHTGTLKLSTAINVNLS